MDGMARLWHDLGMATARKLPSGKWQGRYAVPGGHKSAGTFPTKKAALTAAMKMEGTTGDDLTVGSAADSWLKWRRVSGLSSSSVRKYRDDVNRVKRYVGSLQVRSVRRADIEGLAVTLTDEGYAPNTVNYSLSALKMILDWCVRMDHIPSNPWDAAALVKVPKPSEKALTQDEAARLIANLPVDHRLLVSLLLYTGLRFGEAVALHWSDVNFEQSVIVVQRSWSERLRAFGPTKNRGVRAVPIDRRILGPLRAHSPELVEYPDSRYSGVDNPRSGLVFPRDGFPVTNQAVQWAMRKAAKAAGIDKVTPHDLRHTYASWLAANGVLLQDVQKLLGHDSIKSTERYAKYQIRDFTNVLDALGRASDGVVVDFSRLTVPVDDDLFDESGEFISAIEPDEDDYMESLTFGDAPD